MRKKIFGMIAVPLDRNDKARLLFRARALMRATEKGKAYGQVSAKAYGVLCALLMQFHNAKSGRCFPSYDRICEAAGCCRQTVADALAALEAAGLLSVSNRLLRVRWRDEAALASRTKVVRTSNCYSFPSTRAGALRPSTGSGAESSKSSSSTGTGTQVFNVDLAAALRRLEVGLRGARGGNRGGLFGDGAAPA